MFKIKLAAPVKVTIQSPVTLAASGVLRRCSNLLCDLDDDQYTRASGVLPASTIGKHVRHILDHFAALLLCEPGCAIDYDHRERGTPDETSRRAALARITECETALRNRVPSDDNGLVTIRVMLTADGGQTTLGTTMARELAFAAHHAEHHLAMIAAIAREVGAAVPADLGKAPSTLNHESRQT